MQNIVLPFRVQQSPPKPHFFGSEVFLVFGKRKDLLPSYRKRRDAGGLVMAKKIEVPVKGAHFHASS